MEAADRRCLVAAVMAVVRCSCEGDDVAEEYSGWRAARAESVCA